MGLKKNFKKLVKKLVTRPKMAYDAFLLSYPKCGRTWLTLQVARAIQQHFHVDVPNILKLSVMADKCRDIPYIRVTHDDQPHRKRPNELTRSKSKYAGRKVIFMVRDPRDVLVSYYFHKSKREPERDFWFFQKKRKETHSRFKGTLSEFLDVQIGGFDTILEYYNIWAENRTVPKDFLIVKYEDMHADPKAVLRRVLDFLGLSAITDAEIAEAVEYASFQNMQKLEAGKQMQSYKLKPGNINDADSFKVRKGKVGGYANNLKPEEIELLNRKMAERLTPLYGYRPCRGPSAEPGRTA